MEEKIIVTLSSLKELCGRCHACELSKTRTNMVYGRGSTTPDVLFVGEAPGKNEDLQGEPFVGAAGHRLDQLMSECGIDPKTSYIANVLKCRPPNNRDPRPEEIEACSRFLDAQIELLRPKVIVCLGAFASRHVLQCDKPMYAMRGQLQKGPHGVLVMPTYHPAATIYDRAKLPTLKEDLTLVAETVWRLRHERP